jgi:WD40 repeat protein
VFVSHSSADGTLAGQLRRWLVEDGHGVFLDQDLHDGIEIGEEWQQRLHERLRWADAMVCLLTSAYVSSTWCTAELVTAQNRGSRVLPVRAEPGVSHPLLAAIQQIDATADMCGARAKLAEALRRLDAAGGAGWPDDHSPFPGLRPFDTDLHRVFFGRAQEIEQLAALLRSPAERAQTAVVLVVGPSGCGKSSLVRAGLLPTMADEPGWQTVPAILPGTQPVATLTRELTGVAHQLRLGWSTDEVRRRLDDGGLAELANDLLLAGPRPRRTHLLIVIDQFEELLTQAAVAERARIADLLVPALAGPVQVVGTLRPEFLDQLLADPDLAVLPTRVHTLRPLRREALRAVIEGPARLAGIDVDEDLVVRLVADTDSGEALPLLAYTLSQLADGIRRGGRLLASRYEQLGGVQGALARQADAALADATATSGRRRDQVVRELLRLVTVDEQGRPTRLRVHRDELPEPVAAELDAFVARRLVTTDLDNGEVVVGVAHEAFLSAWPPLAEVITAASTALRARRQIEQAAVDWVENGQPPDRLWERGQLAAALTDTGARLRSSDTNQPEDSRDDGLNKSSGPRSNVWHRRRLLMHKSVVADRIELSHQAREFLRASIRRDRRRRARTSTILSTLLAIALVAAGLAIVQGNVAVRQARMALSRSLASQAEQLVGGQPDVAVLLGLQSFELSGSSEPPASLVAALARLHHASTRISTVGTVLSLAFSPDGSTLAGGDDAGTIQLWSPRSPTLEPTLLGRHGESVNSVAFIGDGALLASASGDESPALENDDSIRIWDVGTRHLHGRPLRGSRDWISSVALRPDGKVLAAASADHAVRLWDVANGQPDGEPILGIEGVVRYSPDGKYLAAVDRNYAVHILDTQSRRDVNLLVGHTDWVSAIAFNSDGSLLASSSWDGTVRVWNVVTGKQTSSLKAHSDSVSALVWSQETLATGSTDGTIQFYNIDKEGLLELRGTLQSIHTGPVRSLAFSPDGGTLASSSDDHTIRLLQTKETYTVAQPLVGHTNYVTSVAFSPNGRLIASGSADGTVRVWDRVTGQPHGAPLSGHTGWVTSVSFSPDGRHLASTGSDRTIRLWDFESGQLQGEVPTEHTSWVRDLAFSPDGELLASAAGDTTIRIWHTGNLATANTVLVGHRDVVNAISFGFHRGVLVLASASDDGTVRLWRVNDGQKAQVLSDHKSPVYGLAFSPTGDLVASGGGDNLVHITNIDNRQEIVPALAGHSGHIRAIAFSGDGHILASGGEDGSTRLWSIPLGAPVKFVMPGDSWINDVAFSPEPNGQVLATASANKNVMIWNLSFNSWTQSGCSLVGRNLSMEEWNRYVPDAVYSRTCSALPAGEGAPK